MPKPELIQSTVADIKAMKPEYIVPAHRTGFEAEVTFGKEMPNEFVINTAGTKYTLYSLDIKYSDHNPQGKPHSASPVKAVFLIIQEFRISGFPLVIRR